MLLFFTFLVLASEISLAVDSWSANCASKTQNAPTGLDVIAPCPDRRPASLTGWPPEGVFHWWSPSRGVPFVGPFVLKLCLIPWFCCCCTLVYSDRVMLDSLRRAQPRNAFYRYPTQRIAIIYSQTSSWWPRGCSGHNTIIFQGLPQLLHRSKVEFLWSFSGEHGIDVGRDYFYIRMVYYKKRINIFPISL